MAITLCGCTGCFNKATHVWSGHPTCDACGTPERRGNIMKTVAQAEAKKQEISSSLDVPAALLGEETPSMAQKTHVEGTATGRCSAGKVVFKKGQDVWDKQGQQYSYGSVYENGHMVEMLAVARYYDEDGDGQDTDVEGQGTYIVLEEDNIFGTAPKYVIPKHLQANIDYAESVLKRVQGQVEHERKKLAEVLKEVQATRIAGQALKERVGKVEKKYPQLHCLMDFVEGEDLWVAHWGIHWGFKIERMSELKGDYGLRMVSLQTECRDSKWIQTYDWCLHQYSDDSGDRRPAVVAGTKEEVIKRVEMFMEKASKMRLSKDSRVLQSMVEAGVNVGEFYKERLQKELEESDKRKQAERERSEQRVAREAKNLGLKLVPIKSSPESS